MSSQICGTTIDDKIEDSIRIGVQYTRSQSPPFHNDTNQGPLCPAGEFSSGLVYLYIPSHLIRIWLFDHIQIPKIAEIYLLSGDFQFQARE